MVNPVFKILFRIAAVTATVILLYELTNLLLVYRYFKFEYYIAGVAITALFAGVMLAKRHQALTSNISTEKERVADLTQKEFQVLEMIGEGKSNKEIASLNFVEVSTVKTHINNIYFKLRVKNRKGAIDVYRQYLLIQKSTFSPPAVI